MPKLTPFYKSSNNDFTLVKGDCRDILREFKFEFDMIFADPPYFLSNGGLSNSNGVPVCVDKGEWDKGGTPEYIQTFNREWISLCSEKLKENGTLWISGTYHNIFTVATILSDLHYKILNVITWAKTDPPENLTHRMFTHSSEFIIWAKKSQRSYHRYNYDVMRSLNNNKQMTDVWYLPAVQKWEKSCGKHPTQKPLALLARIILASTKKGAWILDPFNGSGTTGIAANLLGRKYLGLEQDDNFLDLSKERRCELDDLEIKRTYQEKVFNACHSSEVACDRHIVLVGRFGSSAQKKWFLESRRYNLPIAKILSMPKILSVEYFLALFENNEVGLYKVGKLKPQIRTKEQIVELSNNHYYPQRDKSYWVINLIEDKVFHLEEKCFDRRMIISKQEERGAYWLRNLDEVLEAFH